MSDLPTRYLLALLFDESERESFAADRATAMAGFGLSPEQARAFQAVDPAGLHADAEGRKRYLMSAVCRSYPLTAGAIGSTPRGPEALAGFLASPAVLAGAATRNAAFGGHLARLLQLDAVGLRSGIADFLRPFLALEAGLVDNAARVRQAVTDGQAPPAPRPPTQALVEDGKLVLATAMVAVQLPTSPEVLRAALHGIRPEDAWQRIRGRDLSPHRVLAVVRAERQPVTVLARAMVTGITVEAGGAGGVAPLVEVSHRTVELSGPAPDLLSACDGTVGLSDLPPRQHALALSLVEAGMLELR